MMLSVMNAALAGIQRNQQGIQVAANNIANLNTDGYRTQRPGQPPATPVESTPDVPVPSDVDLATEFVNMKMHEVGVEANAAVVAADRTMGTLLDILA